MDLPENVDFEGHRNQSRGSFVSKRFSENLTHPNTHDLLGDAIAERRSGTESLQKDDLASETKNPKPTEMDSVLQIIRLLKSQPDGGHSQVTQSLKSTVKNGESNLAPKPPKAVSRSILDSTAVTKQDVLGRIRSKSECGNSIPVSENVTQPPKFSTLSGAQRPLPRPELPCKSSSLRSSTISTDVDSKLDCTYEGAVLNDGKKYGTENDINNILSNLSNISSVLFQLKQYQRATYLELLTFQDELSQKIDFVHSNLSKKIVSMQDQMSSVLIVLAKLSKSDVDKKGETQRSGESKRRSEPDTKRTDEGSEEKKSKN